MFVSLQKDSSVRALKLMPSSPWSFALRHRAAKNAFTLLELLVVMAIIGAVAAFLIPTLGPASGRSLDGATRQFTAELESARLLAIAERTKARVLVPVANAPGFGTDLSLRAFGTVTLNKTTGTWKQRGKWNRLAQSTAFDPQPVVDTATQESVLETRKTSVTQVDNSPTGVAATTDFTGAYIEFHANGAASLDPNALFETVVVADGGVDGAGTFFAKNKGLRYTVTVDPLSGSVRIK